MSIYFRGCSLSDLISEYLSGKYKELTVGIPVIKETSVNSKPIISAKIPQNVRNYEFTNPSGKSFVYVGYRIQENGRYGEIRFSEPANCMNCLGKVNPEFAIGIPIAKEESLMIKQQYGFESIYHMIDIFCHIRCAYAELRKRISYQNSIYTNSIIYLSEIYEKTTGLSFSSLKPALDNRLLKIFNGPMNEEEYHKDTKYISKSENLLFIPVIQSIEETL